MENTPVNTTEEEKQRITRRRAMIIVVGTAAVALVYGMLNVVADVFSSDQTTVQVDWSQKLELQHPEGAAVEIDPAKAGITAPTPAPTPAP